MHLVVDLAIILIAVGIFTVLSRALKQPLILGYIIAGFLVGPHLGLVPLSSVEGVEQWSEIGIIFLLFALGLEFSFKKLMSVGSSALITAVVKCLGMMIIGLLTGRILGWSSIECVFLGGILSMSSPSVIMKSYEEMGFKNRPHTSLLFGALVFEDLIAVVLMVLLSTLAISGKFQGTEMVLAIAKLGFFLIIWFLVGIYLIPSLFKWAKKYLNNEILLLTAIGLCFLMVTLAELAGFSSALGAFVMGSILAGTVEGEHIEHLLGSIKDLFGAIFFVSIGMMVDPAIIGEYWPTILILTAVAMIGNTLFPTIGALLAGQGLESALRTGFSVAQLGEFAFIIAALGCSLGVLNDFIYPIVVSAAVLTTFATPYMIKAADPFHNFLIKRLPTKFLQAITPSEEIDHTTSVAEHNEWKHLTKSFFTRILLYGVLLVAILLISANYLPVWLGKIFPQMSETTLMGLSFGISALFMLPLLLAFCSKSQQTRESEETLLKAKRTNRWPILSLELIKVALAVYLIFKLFDIYFHHSFWIWIIIALSAVLMILWSRQTMIKFTHMEERFIRNFNEKEEKEKEDNPIQTLIKEKIAGHGLVIGKVEISPDFPYIGKQLREMPFRHVSEVNIMKIIRGKKSIPVPSGSTIIYPHDILIFTGTKTQIEEFNKIIDTEMAAVDTASEQTDEPIIVDKTILTEESYMANKTLRQIKMKSSGCMVVSILHETTFISNPQPDYKLLPGDCVWVAGSQDNVAFFLK